MLILSKPPNIIFAYISAYTICIRDELGHSGHILFMPGRSDPVDKIESDHAGFCIGSRVLAILFGSDQTVVTMEHPECTITVF